MKKKTYGILGPPKIRWLHNLPGKISQSVEINFYLQFWWHFPLIWRFQDALSVLKFTFFRDRCKRYQNLHVFSQYFHNITLNSKETFHSGYFSVPLSIGVIRFSKSYIFLLRFYFQLLGGNEFYFTWSIFHLPFFQHDRPELGWSCPTCLLSSHFGAGIDPVACWSWLQLM